VGGAAHAARVRSRAAAAEEPGGHRGRRGPKAHDEPLGFCEAEPVCVQCPAAALARARPPAEPVLPGWRGRLRYGDAMRYVHKIEVKRHEIKQRPVTVRTGLALNTAMLMNVPQPKGDWAPNPFRTVSGASSTAQGSARS